MSIGGIILAGGRSSRMGTAKAGLRFGGETLLERMVRVVGEVVQPVVVVVGAEQEWPAIPGVAVLQDKTPDCGPLVGLLTGLEWLQTHRLDAGFVTACDMPFLTSRVIGAIAGELGDAEVAAPRCDGRWQPLAAAYSTSLIPRIQERLAAGQRSLIGLIEASQRREVEPSVLAGVDPDGLTLANVNTPADFERALARLAKGSSVGSPQGLGGRTAMITLRPARIDDAEAISELVTALSRDFITPDYSATGAAVLLEGMTAEETRKRMALGFRYLIAVEGDAIVGVGAMKENSHLYHLFVAETHHGRGIARRLWEHLRETALANGNPGRITVNSSRHAVPIYLRLGFVKDGGVTAKNEITCQPMVWQIAPHDTDEEDRKI
ncbi:putative molybdenum cofactor guanylyltransferase [Caulifigura coniformis]|uniref:Probable molybdenum cofactor guanylyltransferase n=1 Tax=Caulifigura coniformis TaxID=2527983 RepID=A0A517SL85_9PLAN|nr:GNAT family N-acetyltransferase [Caulifigura coniformis]QDT56878.1 putative molybdenum cofactor guanylyltransferase [Caulifigura coniformis]